jgi:hypothetical protein
VQDQQVELVDTELVGAFVEGMQLSRRSRSG